MSTVDYGLIAVVALATSFFGAFGKDLADELKKWIRKIRSLVRRDSNYLDYYH